MDQPGVLGIVIAHVRPRVIVLLTGFVSFCKFCCGPLVIEKDDHIYHGKNSYFSFSEAYVLFY